MEFTSCFLPLPHLNFLLTHCAPVSLACFQFSECFKPFSDLRFALDLPRMLFPSTMHGCSFFRSNQHDILTESNGGNVGTAQQTSPKFRGLKQQFIVFHNSMDQDFRQSSAGWFFCSISCLLESLVQPYSAGCIEISKNTSLSYQSQVIPEV